MPEEAVDISNLQTAAEEVISFDDISKVADEPSTAGGPWPRGWYKATIIEGYATKNGTQWRTEDTASKAGDSRNMRICVHVTNDKIRKGESVTVKRKGAEHGPFNCPELAINEQKDTWGSYNYKIEYLTKENIETVTRLRKLAVDEKWGNKWPSQFAEQQKMSLSLGRLMQLYKALGFGPTKTDAGFINVQPLIGQQLDVHLGLNEDGYNDVTEVAKLNEGGKKK